MDPSTLDEYIPNLYETVQSTCQGQGTSCCTQACANICQNNNMCDSDWSNICTDNCQSIMASINQPVAPQTIPVQTNLNMAFNQCTEVVGIQQGNCGNYYDGSLSNNMDSMDGCFNQYCGSDLNCITQLENMKSGFCMGSNQQQQTNSIPSNNQSGVPPTIPAQTNLNMAFNQCTEVVGIQQGNCGNSYDGSLSNNMDSMDGCFNQYCGSDLNCITQLENMKSGFCMGSNQQQTDSMSSNNQPSSYNMNNIFESCTSGLQPGNCGDMNDGSFQNNIYNMDGCFNSYCNSDIDCIAQLENMQTNFCTSTGNTPPSFNLNNIFSTCANSVGIQQGNCGSPYDGSLGNNMDSLNTCFNQYCGSDLKCITDVENMTLNFCTNPVSAGQNPADQSQQAMQDAKAAKTSQIVNAVSGSLSKDMRILRNLGGGSMTNSPASPTSGVPGFTSGPTNGTTNVPNLPAPAPTSTAIIMGVLYVFIGAAVLFLIFNIVRSQFTGMAAKTML